MIEFVLGFLALALAVGLAKLVLRLDESGYHQDAITYVVAFLLLVYLAVVCVWIGRTLRPLLTWVLS